MHFSQLPIPVRPDLLAGLRYVWDALAAPGTWWSGAERVKLAAAARGTASDEVPEITAGTARLIYDDITATSRRWFDGVLRAGVSMPAFVELVGVVSRLAAVDHFMRAIGQDLEPLPVPQPGDPTGEPPPNVRPGRAWVPMVGPMSITRALSLVPPESEAQEALSGVLYMTYAEMEEQDFERELTRPQMELIASRVSALNECFYWTVSHVEMLRVSSDAFGHEVDLRAVTDPTVDPGIPHGSLLLAFSDAVIRQYPDTAPLRSELREVFGDEGLVGAAGVIGNFSMMNRIADSVGMPMGNAALARTAETRALLGLDRLRRG